VERSSKRAVMGVLGPLVSTLPFLLITVLVR
jgi:hypothetical protein